MIKNMPHCFSHAACFAPSLKYCKQCPVAVECASAVLLKLDTINTSLDVTDLMKSVQSFLDAKGINRTVAVEQRSTKTRFATSLRVTFDTPLSVKSLPVKPQKLAKAICKAGIDMLKDKAQGVNSFGPQFRPTYMANVQQLVNTGRFSPQQLKTAILSDRPLSAGALNNASCTVICALEGLQVIRRSGDHFESFD